MKPTRLLLLAAALAMFVSGSRGTLAADRAPPVRRVGTLSVPGNPLTKFDIGFVNADGIYAFADRSNRSMDFSAPRRPTPGTRHRFQQFRPPWGGRGRSA